MKPETAEGFEMKS